MALGVRRWRGLVEALEELRVAVEAVQQHAQVSPTVPQTISEALEDIHRRLVRQLRPFALERLEDEESADRHGGAGDDHTGRLVPTPERPAAVRASPDYPDRIDRC